jgi:hypothetical protein
MQHERVIAYISRQLKLHEVNYSVYDLELTTMVFFFKDIEVLSIWVSSTNFYGSQEFEIFDDVEEHEYTTTMIVELIKNYYFMIEYHPRRENVVANALSYKNRVVTIILEDCNERGLL